MIALGFKSVGALLVGFQIIRLPPLHLIVPLLAPSAWVSSMSRSKTPIEFFRQLQHPEEPDQQPSANGRRLRARGICGYTLSTYMFAYYVLFFIHLESRRVCLAGITRHSDEEWMQQMARNATGEAWGFLGQRRYALHDRDTKFCAVFREMLQAGVRHIRFGMNSPGTFRGL